MVDDIHIPTIRHLFDFLREDAMFRLLETVGKTAFFERTSSDTFSPVEDGWWLQNYNVKRFPLPYNHIMPTGDAVAHRLGMGERRDDPAVSRDRLLPLVARWESHHVRIAIFGIGGHTDLLWRHVPELTRLDIVAYLDTNPEHHGTLHRGVVVHPPEWTPGHADLVLCSSYTHELTQLQVLDAIPVKAVLSHPVRPAHDR